MEKLGETILPPGTRFSPDTGGAGAGGSEKVDLSKTPSYSDVIEEFRPLKIKEDRTPEESTKLRELNGQRLQLIRLFRETELYEKLRRQTCSIQDAWKDDFGQGIYQVSSSINPKQLEEEALDERTLDQKLKGIARDWHQGVVLNMKIAQWKARLSTEKPVNENNAIWKKIENLQEELSIIGWGTPRPDLAVMAENSQRIENEKIRRENNEREEREERQRANQELLKTLQQIQEALDKKGASPDGNVGEILIGIKNEIKAVAANTEATERAVYGVARELREENEEADLVRQIQEAERRVPGGDMRDLSDSELTALYREAKELKPEDLSEIKYLDTLRGYLLQKMLVLNQGEEQLSPDAEKLQEKLQVLKIAYKYRKDSPEVTEKARKIAEKFAGEYAAISEVNSAYGSWMASMYSLDQLIKDGKGDYNPWTLHYLFNLPMTEIPSWIPKGIFGSKEVETMKLMPTKDREGNIVMLETGEAERAVGMTELISRVFQLEVRFLDGWADIARNKFKKEWEDASKIYGYRGKLGIKQANAWVKTEDKIKKTADWGQWPEALNLNNEIIKSLGYGERGIISRAVLIQIFDSASDFTKANPYYQKIAQKVKNMGAGCTLFDLLAVADLGTHKNKALHIGSMPANILQGKYVRWLFGALAGSQYAEEVGHRFLRSTGEFGKQNFFSELTTWGLSPDKSSELFSGYVNERTLLLRGKKGIQVPVIGRVAPQGKTFMDTVVVPDTEEKDSKGDSVVMSIRERILLGKSLTEARVLAAAGNIDSSWRFTIAQAAKVQELLTGTAEIKFSGETDDDVLSGIINTIYLSDTNWVNLTEVTNTDEQINEAMKKGKRDRDTDPKGGAQFVINTINAVRTGRITPEQASRAMTDLNPNIAWLIALIYPHIPLSIVQNNRLGHANLPIWANHSANGIPDRVVRTVSDAKNAWSLHYQTNEGKEGGSVIKEESIYLLFKLLIKNGKMTKNEVKAVALFFNLDIMNGEEKRLFKSIAPVMTLFD